MGRAALASNVGAAPRGPSEEEGSERSRSRTNEMASSATAEATAVAQTKVRRQRQHSLEVAASPLSFSRVGGRIPSSILLVVMAVASSITLSCTYWRSPRLGKSGRSPLVNASAHVHVHAHTLASQGGPPSLLSTPVTWAWWSPALRTASKIGTGDQHPTPFEPESASEPQIRRLLATAWTATTSRR